MSGRWCRMMQACHCPSTQSTSVYYHTPDRDGCPLLLYSSQCTTSWCVETEGVQSTHMTFLHRYTVNVWKAHFTGILLGFLCSLTVTLATEYLNKQETFSWLTGETGPCHSLFASMMTPLKASHDFMAKLVWQTSFTTTTVCIQVAEMACIASSVWRVHSWSCSAQTKWGFNGLQLRVIKKIVLYNSLAHIAPSLLQDILVEITCTHIMDSFSLQHSLHPAPPPPPLSS